MSWEKILEGLASDASRETKADMLAYLHHGITTGGFDDPMVEKKIEELYRECKEVWLSGEIMRLRNRFHGRRVLGRDLLRMTTPPPGDRRLKAIWESLQALKHAYTVVNPERAGFEECYDVREEIGQGGMSVVFRALRRSDQREVAIKYLKRDFLNKPSMVARFARECELTRSFNHPNIISVFETGEHDGSGYLVMEYLPIGGMDIMAGHPDFNVGIAVNAIRQTARALAHLHQHQVIHRDVKLSNILVSRWDVNPTAPADFRVAVKLCDFGLGKHIPGDGLTRVGTRMGTEYYTAPEMRDAPERADQRADIYALGVGLYRAISRTGFPVGAYPPLHQLNPALPPEIDRLLDSCLQADPERRLGSAVTVDETLAAIERKMKDMDRRR